MSLKKKKRNFHPARRETANVEVGQTIHQVLITFRSPLSAFWAFFRLDFAWYLAERITPPAKSWKSSPRRAWQRQAAAVSTDLHLCPCQGYSAKTRMQNAAFRGEKTEKLSCCGAFTNRILLIRRKKKNAPNGSIYARIDGK